MNDNYPPGVTEYDIDRHAPSDPGDPEDATCEHCDFEQWSDWVGEWFGGEELAEFYAEGYTPREVNKLAAQHQRSLEHKYNDRYQ